MKNLVKMTIDFVDNFDINSIPEDVKNSWIESYTRTYSKKKSSQTYQTYKILIYGNTNDKTS